MSEKSNLNVIQQGFEAVNAHDLDAFIKLLAPNFNLNLMMKPEFLRMPEKLLGPEAFRDYLRMMFTAFPDYRMETITMSSTGNMVYHSMMVHGIHQGPIVLSGGIKFPATGQSVKINVEEFNSFNSDGEFINSTAYLNLFDIMKQFGKNLLDRT